MMKEFIYLDNAATTKVKDEVIKEMFTYFNKEYGNASSPHELGERARKAIELARKKIALELGCRAEEIYFTSGATESNNLAVFGLANANPKKKKIIISPIEHSSVYEPAMRLKELGYDIIVLNVDREGFVDIAQLEKEIDCNTLFVSVIHGNNEFGTLQDIHKIGRICKSKGAIFHTDAVQSFGKEKIKVKDMNIDLLSACAHKIGGPKGAGIIYVKEGIKIKPLFYGGMQERGLRAGTENVPAIIGFAKALELAKKTEWTKIKEIRNLLINGLEKIGGKINGSKERRLSNNVHVSFSGLDAERIVLSLSLRGIMCSTGSACDTKKNEKRVLEAIGMSRNLIRGSIRFTINEDIKRTHIFVLMREISSLLKHKSQGL